MKSGKSVRLSDPQCCWPVAASLGEGPLWSTSKQCVWFVDIIDCRVHQYTPATGERRSWVTPSRPGFVTELGDGGLLVGLTDGLYRFDDSSGDFTLLTPVEAERSENRINDGAVGPHGRLWFGTKNESETEATGGWFSWDGSEQPRKHEEGYVVTNGPAFSADGGTLYHCDSVTRRILQRSITVDGTLGENRVFAEIEDGAGYPDGVAVDSDGYLWVGLFAGWAVRRYAPDGTHRETIRLPCAHVTKPAFGGTDGSTLFLTTARVGLTDADLASQPLAGGLFSVNLYTHGRPLPVLSVR